ncbi:hypothetical protein GGX14DRAFT_557455 [Mycena pura]|uniref:Uncharacterized protein n=1 Tax=Mycena pura TaxID=153505 RepID=A0AAD6YNL6_9AGAR|nr:hypothetical protein GGX14DRAFT_557455 [Mycena pura]
MYRARFAEALRLTLEVRLTFDSEPSEHNAVSLSFIQFIENEKEVRSRPFGVACAYLPHIWAAYLVMETTQRGYYPSHHDQLLMTGPGRAAVFAESLCIESRRIARARAPSPVRALCIPRHTPRSNLARQLYEEITGGMRTTSFAQFRPPHSRFRAPRSAPWTQENTITVTSSLTQLHSIWSLIFEHARLIPATCHLPNQRDRASEHPVLRFLVACSRALALHRELAWRVAIAISPSPPQPTSTEHGDTLADLWAAERLTLLRRQVKNMADATRDGARHRACTAVHAVVTAYHAWPARRGRRLGGVLPRRGGCDGRGGVLPEHAATMETCALSYPIYISPFA